MLRRSVIKFQGIIEWNQGKLPKDNKGYLVDFCDGSPGTIPMFVTAAEVFPDLSQILYEAAEKAGECTWKEGLLVKGNGLFRGISGNGYLLHCLSRSWY